MAAEARWAALVETMLAEGDATYGSEGPQRAFGSTSLKTNGKIFAMLVKDRLVVKLDRRRVDALVASGAGTRFDPGHGRLMKEWLDVEVGVRRTTGWPWRPKRRRSWRDAPRPTKGASTGGAAVAISRRGPAAGRGSRPGRPPRSSGAMVARANSWSTTIDDGTDDAGERPERGALDRQVARRERQRAAVDRLADRGHQLVRAVGDAATDDDERRVEEVHDARQHRTDQPARALEQGDRDRITERGRPRDILGRQAARAGRARPAAWRSGRRAPRPRPRDRALRRRRGPRGSPGCRSGTRSSDRR